MTSEWSLLLLDVQQGLLDTSPELRAQTAVPRKIRQAYAAARGAELLVVAVTVGFRPGYPEIVRSNQLFGGVPNTNRFMEGSDDLRLLEEAVPGRVDAVVRKHREDAFYCTDLELILRAADVKRLALAGYTTSGGVLATLLAGGARDFEITVLSDACADRDETTHEFVMAKIFPKHARTTEVDEWSAALALPQGGASA